MDRWVRAAFLGIFLASAEARSPALAPGASVEGESTLPPTAANASRSPANPINKGFAPIFV